MLSPKWCVAHLFLVAAVLVMLRLGLWQWHRAESSTGGIQNVAYALQWPLFAVFAIVVYGKTLREEARREPGAPRNPLPRPQAPDAQIVRQPGVRVGVSAPSVEVDPDDDEMLAYNARLARLNAAAAAVESAGRAGRDR